MTLQRPITPILLSALLALAGPAAAQDKKEEQRSVIVLIGDGMGTSQITLGRLAAQAKGEAYAFDRFKVVGLQSTRSADLAVTDSAASATALACGMKTNNKMIGMDPSEKHLPSVLDAAHACGLATGLVTTTRITHATPACFATHVKHRNSEAAIAKQFATKGYPQVLIGGGSRHFKEEQLASLRARGYAIENDPAKLMSSKPRSEAVKGSDSGGAFDQPKRSRLVGLISDSHVPYAVDGGARLSLKDMTRKAVEVLASDGPFFLMVEGGRIDHACHAHDAVGALHEQLEFAETIDWALDRAARDKNLLIVVTADHATGDLGIGENTNIEGLLNSKASSEGLTGKNIGDPELQELIKAAYGFELSTEEMTRVRLKGHKYWARTALGHVVSERFGVHFFQPEVQDDRMQKTHGHDGAMVPVFAFGPDADHFAGLYENTEIPKKIVAALGLDAGVPAGSPLKGLSKK